jgi:uncharacterized BrkB/YihY/UPF0761 family membrane protein
MTRRYARPAFNIRRTRINGRLVQVHEGSLLLSWYVTSFGSYNATYGSLGAVTGFMVWMWLSTIIVLVGGEIDAETERQKQTIPRRKCASPWVPSNHGRRGRHRRTRLIDTKPTKAFCNHT